MILSFDESTASILRGECSSVSNDEVADLRSKLELELKNSKVKGIGLAAPQIGINKKMAIIRLGGNFNVDLVNAEISNGYDEAVFSGEGCLSFPGETMTTKRFQEIHVVNNLVWPHAFIAKGLFAVAIQHELDHLNGILLPDRLVKEEEYE